MTTDAEEGQQQAKELGAAAQLQVGDVVRLKAGVRHLRVVAVMGDIVECQLIERDREQHPMSALVKVA